MQNAALCGVRDIHIYTLAGGNCADDGLGSAVHEQWKLATGDDIHTFDSCSSSVLAGKADWEDLFFSKG